MKIIIGSTNPTKINAVKSIFGTECIEAINAKSLVAEQPFSDEETREGAINRAKECADYATGTFGIGLEGGVMKLADSLYLCNWGALTTPEGDTYTASGARIVLPKEIEAQLDKGIELGDIIDTYAHKSGVRNKEGAIGIFTNELISRKEMFSHVVTLLKGQWEHKEKEH